MNWILDAVVFVSGFIAGLSGIYFLYSPSGGFQGGRNPGYDETILFDRHTWSDLHLWGSIAMIIAILIHVAYHWAWIKSMVTKVINSIGRRGSGMSWGGRVNLLINLVIGLSFLLTAMTGTYFLFTPTGGFQGGFTSGWDSGILFSRSTWDLVHMWSGVILIIAAMFHFVIHWRWIKNVTYRFFASLFTAPKRRPTLARGVH
jgi:hypothetical protein